MPIGKDEWEQGRGWDTMEGQIILFLRNNKASAYTLTEITNALGNVPPSGGIWTIVGGILSTMGFQFALENLQKEGKVRAKKVKTKSGDEVYYMAA